MLITIKRGSEQLQEDVPAKFRAACSRNGNLGGIYEKFEKPAAPGEPAPEEGQKTLLAGIDNIYQARPMTV